MDRSNPPAGERDPLGGSPWSEPGTVAGFVESPPNDALMQVAELHRQAGGQLLDIGCGAGRNALPLVRTGWTVTGVDLSSAMLAAAGARVQAERLSDRIRLVQAPMDRLPFRDACFDFVVAHGIWNLAPSDRTLDAAVGEAARVARPGAALFLFTFSRSTLPPTLEPATGEQFVFTEFSGQRQTFLTGVQVIDVLGRHGFEPDLALSLRELNKPAGNVLRASRAPVFYEGLFRRIGS